MTPAQLYARERRELAAKIRAQTPRDELHGELISRIRPAIALDSTPVTDAHISLGASKFGGAPDVPDGFEIFAPFGHSNEFFAQINLDEIAPLDIEGVLPCSGVLSFFAAFDATGQENRATEVFYFPRITQRLVLRENAWNWNAVTLTPRLFTCPLNSTNAEFYDHIGDPLLGGAPGIADWPFDGEDAPTYQLLGYPASVQNDVRYSSAADGENWRDWLLLFSMDGDPNAQTLWGDSGMLYWTIRANDLKQHNFKDCRFHFDTC